MRFCLKRPISVIVLFLLVAAATLGTPQPVKAGVVITVDTTLDSLNPGCSLRDAIIAVNTKAVYSGCPKGSGSGDIIFLPAGVYELDVPGTGGDNDPTKGDLDILAGVTITGTGASTVIKAKLDVDKNSVLKDRIFHVKSTSSVNINNLVISGGDPGWYSNRGGGILNDSGSTLYLDRVLIEGNQVVNPHDVNADAMGGGVFNDDASLTIHESVIKGNYAKLGGGVYNGGTITIRKSLLQSNAAKQTGGAIDHNPMYTGTATIINSTFSDNSAPLGAAIATAGLMALTHATIKDQVAPSGTGINHGLFIFSNSTVKMSNTLFVNNDINCVFADSTNSIVESLGYNLEDKDQCKLNTLEGDQKLVANPGVSSTLADNGGPTMTYALEPGSPAIGVVPLANCFLTDQRGFSRWDTFCDIGAYEDEGGIVLNVFLPLISR